MENRRYGIGDESKTRAELLKELEKKSFIKGIENLQKATWDWLYRDHVLSFKYKTRKMEVKKFVNKVISIKKKEIKKLKAKSFEQWRINDKIELSLKRKNIVYLNLLDVISQKLRNRIVAKRFHQWNKTHKELKLTVDKNKEYSIKSFKRIKYFFELNKKKTNKIVYFHRWIIISKKLKEMYNKKTEKARYYIKMQNIMFNGKDLIKNFEEFGKLNRKMNTTKSLPIKYKKQCKFKLYHAFFLWKNKVKTIENKIIDNKCKCFFLKNKIKKQENNKLLRAFNFWKKNIFINILSCLKKRNFELAIEKLNKKITNPFINMLKDKIKCRNNNILLKKTLQFFLKKNDNINLKLYFDKFKIKNIQIKKKCFNAKIIKNIKEHQALKMNIYNKFRLIEAFNKWKNIKKELECIEKENNIHEEYRNLIFHNAIKHQEFIQKENQKFSLEKSFYLWRLKKSEFTKKNKELIIRNKLCKNIFKEKQNKIKINLSKYLNNFKNKAKKLQERDKALVNLNTIYDNKNKMLMQNSLYLIANYAKNKDFYENEINHKTKNLINLYRNCQKEDIRNYFKRWNECRIFIKNIEEKSKLNNCLKERILKHRIHIGQKVIEFTLIMAFRKWKLINEHISVRETEENIRFLQEKIEKISKNLNKNLNKNDKINLSFCLNKWKNNIQKEKASNCIDIHNTILNMKSEIISNNIINFSNKLYMLYFYIQLNKFYYKLQKLLNVNKKKFIIIFLTNLSKINLESQNFELTNLSKINLVSKKFELVNLSKMNLVSQKFGYKVQIKKDSECVLNKLNFKANSVNPKSIQMKSDENKNASLFIVPYLYEYLDYMYKKPMYDLFNNLKNIQKSKKFIHFLSTFMNKNILPYKKYFISEINSIKEFEEKYKKSMNILQKMFHKYYINTIANGLIHSGKINRIIYLMKISFMHHNINRNRYLRKLLKKWRFVSFIQIMSKRKLENVYQTMHLSYLQVSKDLFSLDNMGDPSASKEFERFGNKIGMFDNEDPELKNKYCASYLKKYKFQPNFSHEDKKEKNACSGSEIIKENDDFGNMYKESNLREYITAKKFNIPN